MLQIQSSGVNGNDLTVTLLKTNEHIATDNSQNFCEFLKGSVI